MKVCRFGILALAGWLILAGFLPAAAWADKLSEAGNPIMPVQLHNVVVQAEVVATPEKLYLGLGGRKRLAPGSGMLFVMPTFDVQEFCMRGMQFPIDIIWIAQDRIIGFQENLSPKDPGEFLSPAPANLVLEVPAGFVKSAGLKVGDRLERPGMSGPDKYF
jgi:uncharacterized membrane protein (UPF0127 family)